MKPFLRLITGYKPPSMKFASFGRERDLDMIHRYISDPEVKRRYLRQTSAAHDLNEGIGSLEAFAQATRDAVLPSSLVKRDAPLTLLARIARYYPECLQIWDQLAASPKWQDRFTVACRLYSQIPDRHSDKLFNILRHDKSNRVRKIAVDRYSNRPNKKGQIVFGVFDPNKFDARLERGEVIV